MIELVTILPNPIKYGPENFMQKAQFLKRYEFLFSVLGLTNQDMESNDVRLDITSSYNSSYLPGESHCSNVQDMEDYLLENSNAVCTNWCNQ